MKHHINLDPSISQPPTRDLPPGKELPVSLPPAKETKVHPNGTAGDGDNAKLMFVGTATVILYVDVFMLWDCGWWWWWWR